MSGRGLRSRRVARAAAVALLAVIGLTSPGGSAEQGGGLAQVGRLPSVMTINTRSLSVDASARRIFEVGEPNEGGGTQVVGYDLDTLRRAGALAIVDSAAGPGGKLVAVDELRHRMFVLYPVRIGAGTALDSAGSAAGGANPVAAARVVFAIGVVDTLRLRLLGTRLLSDLVHHSPNDLSGNNVGFKAMSYFAPEDKLYLVSEDTTGRVSDIKPANHVVFLHQLDVPRLLDAQAAGAQDWAYPVPQYCPMSMAQQSTGVVLRSARAPEVFFACRPGNILEPQVPGEIGGVLRVNIVPGAMQADVGGFTADFFPISGNLALGLVSMDPVAERFLVGTDISATEPRVWIFDAPSASWIGFVVTPPVRAIAVDVSRGRLFALSAPFVAKKVTADGVVASTRAHGADQGTLTSFVITGTPELADRAVVDPIRHRVFWATKDYYMVIEDRTPFRPAVAEEDPDADTIDVREGPETGANLLGGARAYAARMRVVGGWRGAERNVNSVIPPPTANDPSGLGFFNLPVEFFPAFPSEGTRDVHMARVRRSVLTGTEATAEAVGGDRDDDNTGRDIFNWTTYVRDRGGPDYVGKLWPYPTVDCTDFGGAESRRAGRGASVTCSRSSGKVSAEAENVSPFDFQLPEGISIARIGEGSVHTYSMRDRRRGIVSGAVSEVRGIDFGDRAGIGRITARAETWATGRPRASNRVGAGSRYSRVIEDVWVRQEDGSTTTVCSSPCSPQLVAQTLTRALGTRVRIDLPEPDPLLARGTPGGYEALIVRNPFERLNDVSQNAETDIRLEVPAMVVSLFVDGRVPSRVVVSLAGVSAESHYGIYRLAREERAPPGGRLTVDVPSVGPTTPPSEDGSVVVPGQPSRTITTRVAEGIRFIVATPGRAVRAFGLWAFLAAPLVLVSRRRILDRFAGRDRGGG